MGEELSIRTHKRGIIVSTERNRIRIEIANRRKQHGNAKNGLEQNTKSNQRDESSRDDTNKQGDYNLKTKRDGTRISNRENERKGIRNKKEDGMDSNQKVGIVEIENELVTLASKVYFKEKHLRQRLYEGLDPWNEHLDILDTPGLLMLSSRSTIFDVLHTIKFDEKMIKNKCYNTTFMNIMKNISKITMPRKYEMGWYKCSNSQGRPYENKYRYIANFDVGDFIRKYPRMKLTECVTEEEHEVHGVQELLRLKLNQSRGINLAKMTLSLIEAYYYSGFHRLYGREFFSVETSLIFYVLFLLLKQFDDMPFFDRPLEMELTEVSWSSQLPLLWYCLLNLCVQFLFGNVNEKEVSICIDIWIEWAIECLDQKHLDNKGDMTAINKILMDAVKRKDLIEYSSDGIPMKIFHDDDMNEIWEKGEKELLLNNLLKNEDIPESYKQYFEECCKVLKDVDEYRRVRVAISIMANPGNFKKTSPVLDLERSILPRVIRPVAYPKVKKMVDGIGPLEFYWDDESTLGKYANELFSYTVQIRERVKNIDWTASFWNKLTNNSAGRKATSTSQSDFVAKFSSQRLIQAVLDVDAYYDKAKFLEILAELGLIGFREQNDRRIRCIEIVPNVLQLLMQIGLELGNALAKFSSDLSSGKQVGDIRDMVAQLKASGDPNFVLESLDISGMDASKQEPLLWVAYQLAIYVLSTLDIERYFWSTSMDCDVITYDKNDIEMLRSTSRQNALIVFIITVMNLERSTDFCLVDKMFYDKLIVNGMMFWSGRFDTSMDHNLTLKPFLSVCTKEHNRQWLDDQVIRRNLISGDDIFSIKKGSDEAILREAKMVIEQLDLIGFKATPELSRFGGVFLQQWGAFGRVIPLPARISLVCAERGDSRERNIYSQMDELDAIVNELAARSYIPEACVSLLLAIWNTNRIMKLKTDNDKAFEILKTKECSIRANGTRRIYGDKNTIIMIIPYISIFLSEWISVPLRKMRTKYGTIRNSSHLQPKGDISNVIMRPLFMSPDVTSDKTKRIMERKAAKMKREYLEITGRELQIIDMKEFKINQADVIDQDIYTSLEIDYAKFLLSLRRDDLLETSRLNEESMMNLEPLMKTLQSQLPLAKVEESARSYAILRMTGHRVSRGLVFAYSSEQRIKNAVTKPSESMKERRSIDVELLRLISGYRNGFIRERNEGMFNVSWEWRGNISPPNEFYINQINPICVSSHTLGEMCNILKYTGIVNRARGSISIFRGNLESEMWKGIQIDKVVEEGIRIYRRDRDAISLYFSALQIPSTLRQPLQSLIEDGFVSGFATYRSVIQPRRYFMLSTLPSTMAMNYTVWLPSYSNHQVYRYADSVARDLILTYGHLHNEKLRIQVNDETAYFIKNPRL